MAGSHTATSFSTFTSETTTNGHTTGSQHTRNSHTDSNGNTTVYSSSQNMGEPAVERTAHYDAQGRQLEGGDGQQQGRIEELTDADKKYEEAMEEEYAKREGGA